MALSKRLAMALLFCAALLPLPARAQDKPVSLKFSYWVPAAHPLAKPFNEWARDIEAASGGSIKITLFPAEQLGKAFDHYDMTRDGIADLAYVNPGYQPGRFPVIAAAQLPFVFSEARNGSAALDEWYRAYAGKEMADTHFCFAFIHDPGAFHSRLKITVPGDIAGLKVRPAHSTMAEFVKSLGGTNVQGSAPEVRELLDRGVADAVTFPWGSVFLFGIDKVVKFHLDLPLYATVFTISMNAKVYEGMSEAQKKNIDAHCSTEWAEKIGGAWGDFEAAGREKMRGLPGHEMTKPDAAQTEAWKKAAAPLVASWAEGARKVGVDPDAAIAAFRAAMVKHGADK